MKSQPISFDRRRPIYYLFDALVRLQADSEDDSLMTLDILKNAHSGVLGRIADNANTLQRAIHLGTAAIARCLALAAPDAIDGDQCGAGTIEAVGWILAEMADMAAICHHLEITARRIVRESSQ